eukprot:SAG31_NODE_45252_length_259_cov_1.037500_1_plen_37_part_10
MLVVFIMTGRGHFELVLRPRGGGLRGSPNQPTALVVN